MTRGILYPNDDSNNNSGQARATRRATTAVRVNNRNRPMRKSRSARRGAADISRPRKRQSTRWTVVNARLRPQKGAFIDFKSFRIFSRS